MFDLFIIGDICQDNFLLIEENQADLRRNNQEASRELCFDFGGKILVKKIYRTFGGNAFNVSIGAARLGLAVAVFSTVGSNKNWQEAKKILRENHVSIGNIAISDSANDNFSMILVYQKERTILTHHQKFDYRLLSIPETRWIYLTSLSDNFAEYDKIIDFTKKSDTKLIFQPGSSQIQSGLDKFKKILSQSQIFIANLNEYQIFLKSDKNIPQELLIKMKNYCQGVLVLTDGQNGAFLLENNEFKKIHTNLNQTIVETTGAGDAFSIGFCAAKIFQKDSNTALKWGMINSESVIGYLGAQQGLLTKQEIDRNLQFHESIST